LAKENGSDKMSFTIRKAVNKDFAEIYELICELVDSPVGGISFSALEKIYQANLHSEIKRQYVAELSGEIVRFISLTFDMRLSEAGKVAVIDELVVKKNNETMVSVPLWLNMLSSLRNQSVAAWLRLQPIFAVRTLIAFMRKTNLSKTVIGLALMILKQMIAEKLDRNVIIYGHILWME